MVRVNAKILRPAHVAAGLTLIEPDDHITILLHDGAPVCRWLVTSVSPTITDIHAEADMYIKYNKGVTA